MIVTAVELTPITGRTHQLRVHMAHSGYPMLGDTLYASESIMTATPRLELHAHTIKFLQPSTKEEIYIEAPILLSPHVCPPDGFACATRSHHYSVSEENTSSALASVSASSSGSAGPTEEERQEEIQQDKQICCQTSACIATDGGHLNKRARHENEI
jgi:hypothetical protein